MEHRPVDKPRTACRLCASAATEADPLLVRYSPDLVVFPETTDLAAPPWPAQSHDYHPRTVWVFIDQCRAFDSTRGRSILPQIRAGLVGAINPLLSLGVLNKLSYIGITIETYYLLVGVGIALLLLSVSEMVTNGLSHVGWLALVFGFACGLTGFGLYDWYQFRERSSGDRHAIQRRLEQAWPSRLETLDLSICGRVDANSAWRRYRRVIHKGDDLYPRTVYGRLARAGRLIAVQYWLFFFYNHWRNVHEADWETMVVLHDPETDAPRDVCLSSHDSGHRRFADAVMWNGSHPIVFVAVGSHGLYFEPRPEGYDASVTFKATSPFFRTHGQVSAGNARDIVPAISPPDVFHLPETKYHLAEMPNPTDLRPASENWSDWWWLAYGGMWGRVLPIRGPAFQSDGPAGFATKWADPKSWADTVTFEELSRHLEPNA